MQMNGMKIKRCVWVQDNGAVYILPFIGFSFGKEYGRRLFVGWLYWLFEVYL